MDRTMYGKVQPGTYHPYRCTRKNGSSPGCKYVMCRFHTFACVINTWSRAFWFEHCKTELESG